MLTTMVYPDDDKIIISALSARFFELECSYKRFYRASDDFNAHTVAELCYDIARILKDRYNFELVEFSDTLRVYIQHRFADDSVPEFACDDLLFNPEFD